MNGKSRGIEGKGEETGDIEFFQNFNKFAAISIH
jgi:hypothetical protein